MRGDENTHSKGERVKISRLPYRVGKRSGTMVTTILKTESTFSITFMLPSCAFYVAQLCVSAKVACLHVTSQSDLTTEPITIVKWFVIQNIM